MFAFGAQLHALSFLSKLDHIACLNGGKREDLRHSYSTNTLLKSSFNSFDENKDDYYKDLKGNIIYDESINSKQDFIDRGLSGKYLGKTHTEGNSYFNLWGDEFDLETDVGKIVQKIDEAVLNYASWINDYDGYKQITDMRIGRENKGGVLSSVGDDLINFDYYGGKAQYHSFHKRGMGGLLDRGNGKLNQNKGSFSLPPGYNIEISNTNSRGLRIFNILKVSFPNIKSYNRFNNKIDYEFFGKENPKPIKKFIFKNINK